MLGQQIQYSSSLGAGSILDGVLVYGDFGNRPWWIQCNLPQGVAIQFRDQHGLFLLLIAAGVGLVSQKNPLDDLPVAVGNFDSFPGGDA